MELRHLAQMIRESKRKIEDVTTSQGLSKLSRKKYLNTTSSTSPKKIKKDLEIPFCREQSRFIHHRHLQGKAKARKGCSKRSKEFPEQLLSEKKVISINF